MLFFEVIAYDGDATATGGPGNGGGNPPTPPGADYTGGLVVGPNPTDGGIQ